LTGTAQPDQVSNDIEFSSDIFKTIKEVMAGRIARIAYHRVRVYVAHEGTMSLVKYFCLPDLVSRERRPPGPLSRCENFELHAHKVYEITTGININSWVRCKTGRSIDDESPVLSIDQDLNTLAEEAETRDFAVADATGLFRFMADEATTIFDLYFPQGVPA
jgi:hypothetical protein